MQENVIQKAVSQVVHVKYGLCPICTIKSALHM